PSDLRTCASEPERRRRLPTAPAGPPRRETRRSVRNRLERVRKTSAALATLALAVVALTGCSTGNSFDGVACDRGASASGIEDLADISGAVGSTPDVELFTPVGGAKSTFGDVIVGSGPALTT